MKPTDQKQALVAQAARHRQGMVQAGHALAEGLHPGALVQAVGGLALTGLALLRNKKSGVASGGMAALLPLALPVAMRGLSLLGRFKPSGPTTRKLLAAGALGALAAFALKRASARRRRTRHDRP
ncbi:hypothetical protein [Janthinobacterium sp. 17J80-10]|uniref:hypothetical protein n=1 Tax=Janthinobacterium sp. 17J80-10 TaxID=2497863 RepID=UPI00100597B0|nr:hypothetical protein [Janthinobacterium sp. 17J80-10]QAU32827.1 hypothetical protein EKL02_00815 [Janthinobacterium sp. 17J80-10]